MCREFFPHLAPERLWRKRKEIALPMHPIEGSQKALKGVHLTDYLVALATDAREDCRKLHGRIG